MAAPLTRKQHLERLELLKSERATWISHWQDIADHIAPTSFRYLASEKGQSSGRKKNSKIINGEGTFDLRTLAAGLMTGVSSPSRPWFRLTVSDPDLAEDYAVKEYLGQVEQLLRDALAKSNIYNVLHTAYSDLPGFGTAVIYIEENAERAFAGFNFPLGQYCLAANDTGIVDTLYREFGYTVRQLVEKFGLDACSSATRAAYERRNFDQWIEVVHIITPNGDYRPNALGPKGMRFSSLWLEKAGDGDGFLREGGYQEQPFAAPRWATTGEDVYGRGPGMDCLGDVRALQVLEKRAAMVVDKLANPPMVGPASLQSQRVSLLPGDMTYVDGLAANSLFRPAHEVNPAAVVSVEQKIERHERRIQRAFYADILLMLASSSGQMTATEVAERREEKLLQLGPVLERIHPELLSVVIERGLGILSRQGKLPPPPEVLAGREVGIQYISILAQAQKLLGTTGIERLVTFVVNTANASPEVLDTIDLDKTVASYSEMLGTPPALVRSQDVIASIRKKRAEAQAQAQQAAALQQGAETAKTLASAPTDGDNALTTMLRGLGQ